jgi:hypothetical protein
MLLKLILWTLLYPLVVAGYALMSIFEICVFVFNSPVDVWMIISDSVDNPQEE